MGSEADRTPEATPEQVQTKPEQPEQESPSEILAKLLKALLGVDTAIEEEEKKKGKLSKVAKEVLKILEKIFGKKENTVEARITVNGEARTLQIDKKDAEILANPDSTPEQKKEAMARIGKQYEENLDKAREAIKKNTSLTQEQKDKILGAGGALDPQKHKKFIDGLNGIASLSVQGTLVIKDVFDRTIDRVDRDIAGIRSEREKIRPELERLNKEYEKALEEYRQIDEKLKTKPENQAELSKRQKELEGQYKTLAGKIDTLTLDDNNLLDREKRLVDYRKHVQECKQLSPDDAKRKEMEATLTRREKLSRGLERGGSPAPATPGKTVPAVSAVRGTAGSAEASPKMPATEGDSSDKPKTLVGRIVKFLLKEVFGISTAPRADRSSDITKGVTDFPRATPPSSPSAAAPTPPGAPPLEGRSSLSIATAAQKAWAGKATPPSPAQAMAHARTPGPTKAPSGPTMTRR